MAVASTRRCSGCRPPTSTRSQLRRDHVLPDTGTHVVQFIQTFDGIAAARGGSLGLAVQKDGSVLSYTGETVRSGT